MRSRWGAHCKKRLLPRRDAEWMGQVHRLGLSVDLSNKGWGHLRKKNYDCDITYVTNSEVGRLFTGQHGDLHGGCGATV